MNEQVVMKNNVTTDDPSSSVSAGTKMFPMKLFSSWDVEKSSPQCIPRLCSLTITRLVIKKVLETDLHSVIVAIKMQSSKRILRSNEILVQKNGLLDTELDITFSLQYSHHLKRDCSRLQIMLQRRKKYKNRTMLGFKTLAVGQVSMSQVLQHPMDREMNLHSCTKDGRSETVARIVILSLSTQPVYQDDRLHVVKDRYQYDVSDEDDLQDDGEISSNDGISDCETGEETAIPRQRNKASSLGNAFINQQKNLKQKFISLIKKFKVTDEVLQSAVQEMGRHGGEQYIDDDMFYDVESLSDSNPDMDAISLQSVPKPKLRPFFDVNPSMSMQEANRVALDYEQDSGKKPEKQEAASNKKSEKSAAELSAKKVLEKTNQEYVVPGQNKRGMDKGEGNAKKSLDKPASDTSSSKKNDKNSEAGFKKSEKFLDRKAIIESWRKSDKGGTEAGQVIKTEKSALEAKKAEFDCFAFQAVFQDQLSAIASAGETPLECIVFMNYQEPLCSALTTKFQEARVRVVNTSSHSDVKVALNAIINRVQKFLNTVPLPTKLVIVGSEAYGHSIVRAYVKFISSRSQEITNHVRFLVAPLGNSNLCQNLALLDTKYAKLFNDSYWKDLNTEKLEEADLKEVVSRILMYIYEASHLVMFPFTEVVLTYRDKGVDDSSQMVVPFLGEIKLKPSEVGSDDDANNPPQASLLDKLKEATSHNAPAQHHTTAISQPLTSVTTTPTSSTIESVATTGSMSSEELELQMDYWLLAKQEQSAAFPPDKSAKKDAKSSLKTSFRSVQIFRPNLPSVVPQQLFSPLHPDASSTGLPSGLSMVFITKDKKQKIMRIGKKAKEVEGLKSQQIDGISRLICTSKSQNQLLTVNIDGMDWTGIKFFQVSSHWQTHFKHLPILIFGFSSDGSS